MAGIAIPANFRYSCFVSAVKAPSALLVPKNRVLAMEDYIKAALLENEFEAQLLDSILTERDIPHRIRSYYDTAYDGLFQTQLGWGCVSSPESYQEEIQEILFELRREASRVEASSLHEDDH